MPERTTATSHDNSTSEAPDSAADTTAAEDVEALRDRAESAEEERDKYLEMLQRSKAEFENYRKRLQQNSAEDRRYAQFDLARELLPVLDNLQLALDAASTRSELDTLMEGVRLVQSQFLDTLSRFGVNRVDALGKSFDPEMHEAVSVEPRSDVEHGTITQVMEPGFRLHERLLRPAKVVVAAEPRD
jgi:molecular chaperone GrpE